MIKFIFHKYLILGINFRVNPIRSFSPKFQNEISKGMYCLGKLEKGNWNCIERRNKVIRSNTIKEFDVYTDGTYAIIISPHFVLLLFINISQNFWDENNYKIEIKITIWVSTQLII